MSQPQANQTLIMQHLAKRYGKRWVVKDVSFSVEQGQVVGLLGPNGAGKTTSFYMVVGLVNMDKGQIQLGNRDLSALSMHERAASGIGYLPQEASIFRKLTVEENILIGMAKFKGTKTRKVPEHLYEIFPVLEEMKYRRGGDLSGGQQQQLAIARALASEPRVLILDEPTEGIQPSIIKDIGRVIRKLADGGEMAIVLVEQFYDFAEELADGYTVMARGQVIAQGIGSEMPEKGIRDLVAI